MSTGHWALTGRLAAGLSRFATASLADGRVLVAGCQVSGGAPTASAERYDPVTALWSAARTMPAARFDPAAVRLLDGACSWWAASTLAARSPPPISTTRRPTSGTGRLDSRPAPRADRDAARGRPRARHRRRHLLRQHVKSTELYDPGRTCVSRPDLDVGRYFHTSRLLPVGYVLISVVRARGRSSRPGAHRVHARPGAARAAGGGDTEPAGSAAISCSPRATTSRPAVARHVALSARSGNVYPVGRPRRDALHGDVRAAAPQARAAPGWPCLLLIRDLDPAYHHLGPLAPIDFAAPRERTITVANTSYEPLLIYDLEVMSSAFSVLDDYCSPAPHLPSARPVAPLGPGTTDSCRF